MTDSTAHNLAAVAKFNAEVDVQMANVRQAVNVAIVDNGAMPVTVALAHALAAAEVAHFAGVHENRTDDEIIKMVEVLAQDMVAHVKRVCGIVAEQAAESASERVEDVPFLEVANG